MIEITCLNGEKTQVNKLFIQSSEILRTSYLLIDKDSVYVPFKKALIDQNHANVCKLCVIYDLLSEKCEQEKKHLTLYSDIKDLYIQRQREYGVDDGELFNGYIQTPKLKDVKNDVICKMFNMFCSGSQILVDINLVNILFPNILLMMNDQRDLYISLKTPEIYKASVGTLLKSGINKDIFSIHGDDFDSNVKVEIERILYS